MYTAVKNMEETHGTVEKKGSKDEAIKVKVPKRILHFSDGVLEEYSDDEVDCAPQEKEQTVVDPRTLTWGPWMAYKAWMAGSSVLSVFDYMGESLASFFGITTPKYYFELEEYKRREAEKKAEQEEAKGWSEPSDASPTMRLNEINTSQPTANSDGA